MMLTLASKYIAGAGHADVNRLFNSMLYTPTLGILCSKWTKLILLSTAILAILIDIRATYIGRHAYFL